MANNLKENAGGISFNAPAFTFGSTNAGINGGYSFDLPMATIQSFSNSALSFSANNAKLNRGFLDNVIGRSQNSVTATADRSFLFQETALSSINSISAQMADINRKAISKKSRGCFITTAICQSDGKPDNCPELQTLRKFRDEYMLHDPELSKYVQEYYDSAPAIVEAIDKRKDAAEIYQFLKINFLEPAIAAIVQGKYHAAFAYYLNMFVTAKLFIE